MELEFIDEEITSWGGLSILKKMIDKLNFVQLLDSLPLPEQGSNRGYPPTQLLIQFMTGLWCGANRYAHLDVTRFDKSIQKLFGWDSMPEHKAFQRYFNKFNIQTTNVVFGGIYKWFFSNLKFDHFTLDIDSSVLTRYGDKQGSEKGYNKHKPGRKSHHPLIAFVAEIEMVANFWLRPGDSYTSNNFKAFLEETLSFFENKTIGLLRLDSGFYDHKIFSFLEDEKSIDYIVATPMFHSIQKSIFAQKTWLEVTDGIEITEFEYQGKDWKKTRRMVAVRQKIAKRPKAVGKQLSIFEDEIETNGYRYTCYITSLKLNQADIWRLYRGRANCENRIKELKYDYGLDKMNQESFDGTEASLLTMTIAYNMMSLFKQIVIGEKVKQRLSTLRYKMLAIPTIIEKSNNKIIIKMALQMNRHSWIRKLWVNSGKLDWNYS
jgi:hypothetical protein